MQALLLPFIHFGALLGFIFYKAKSPFGVFVKNRHQEVVTGLNKAKTQAAEAAKKKLEIESQVRGLDTEKQKIISEWKEREMQQIKAISETTQRIILQLKTDSELNLKAQEIFFKKETTRNIGLQVIALAEAKLKSGMNAAAQEKLNQEFIRELTGA